MEANDIKKTFVKYQVRYMMYKYDSPKKTKRSEDYSKNFRNFQYTTWAEKPIEWPRKRATNKKTSTFALDY